MISSKKWTKTRAIGVKTNLFVRFFEEIEATKNLFEINWPLAVLYVAQLVSEKKNENGPPCQHSLYDYCVDV